MSDILITDKSLYSEHFPITENVNINYIIISNYSHFLFSATKLY